MERVEREVEGSEEERKRERERELFMYTLLKHIELTYWAYTVYESITYVSTGTAVFLNRKRVNVCEHTTKTASLESLRKVPPGDYERDGWREIIWD